MNSIKERYTHLLIRMMSGAKQQKTLSDQDVYQEGETELLPYVDQIVRDHLLPGSGITGMENLSLLLEKAKAGESCLLLLEHYSNFDLPALHYLLRQSGETGTKLAEALVSIAGIKLSESNPIINAFAQAYTRIVIYPSRSLEIIKQNYKDPNKLYHEVIRSMNINRAAIRVLNSVKGSGKIVLVFPAGTRYRPGDPATKRGVREIASYIKSFDNFCLMSINGNILRINPTGEMEEDLLNADKVIFTAGQVYPCERLLGHIKEEHHFRDDKKQELVDHIMEGLERMHNEVETGRLP
ncbi:MAG: 1-acyl-sn-glycerol-3-phosphate acyltransferase [Spirochaetes bacterium]|nr:1-acyl-sn-glycerol-3-phosphate acyltransferase [Spirochaetota bacterium]